MNTQRITSNEAAIAYLKSVGEFEGLTVENNRVVWFKECGRCGGSGHHSYNPQDGTMCWGCSGQPERVRREVRTPLKVYAQKIKRRRTAAAKRTAELQKRYEERAERKIEAQRDWCEKNGHGRITFEELDVKRAEEREASKAISQHVGQVGKRLDLTAKVVFVTSWDTQWGRTVLTVMADDQGNKLVQKGRSMNVWSEEGDLVVAEPGDTIVFKATVKSHGEREGEKQTVVTRPKVARIEKAADPKAESEAA